jgi:hypothetical protein
MPVHQEIERRKDSSAWVGSIVRLVSDPLRAALPG